MWLSTICFWLLKLKTQSWDVFAENTHLLTARSSWAGCSGSAIHRIVIFLTDVKMPEKANKTTDSELAIIKENPRFRNIKFKPGYTEQRAILERLKNQYPVDSAIRLSYNRPQVYT